MLENPDYLERLFSLGSMLAMLGWAILLLLPRRFALLNLIPAVCIPLLLSFAYAGLISVSLNSGEGGDFGSLAGVKQLLSNDVAMLAGWFHYLAFDLFIGCIIAKRADAIGIHRLVQTPFLFLTFMAGPLGLFLFYCVYGGWHWWRKLAPAQERANHA